MNKVVRRYTTQMEVLQAIRDRLIDAVPGYTHANCFILDQPIPPDFPIGRECCTIAPGGGAFVDAMFAGAGYRVVTENATTLVTPMVRQVRDAPRTASKALLDQGPSIKVNDPDAKRCLLEFFNTFYLPYNHPLILRFHTLDGRIQPWVNTFPGPERVVPALLDKDMFVRFTAIFILGKIRLAGAFFIIIGTRCWGVDGPRRHGRTCDTHYCGDGHGWSCAPSQ